jgi:hypothetical protein
LWLLAVIGHGQDDACQVQQQAVVLKDRSLDGFLHVAPIALQIRSFFVNCRALVVLDGRLLALWHPPPEPVHTCGLPLSLRSKPAISHHLQNMAVEPLKLTCGFYS